MANNMNPAISISLEFLLLAAVGLLCWVTAAEAAPITMPRQGLLKTGQKLQETSTSFQCEFCKVVSSVLELYLEEDDSEEEIEKILSELCILLKIEDANVCNSAVMEFKDEVLAVAYYITLGQAKQACAILLGPSCATAYDPWDQEWNITIPGGKPPVKPIPDPKAGSPVTRILHLSDIHWDMNYTVGLSTDCGEPICCRPPNKPGTGSSAAGIWGSYNCDLANTTLHNLMGYLNSIQDQYDLVYMTGDLPAHNVWNQSRQEQLFVLNTIATLMKQYLPTKSVYFTFGNHEGVPVDSFPPPNVRDPSGSPALQWLLDDAAEAWGKWLSQDSITTLKYGGYYNEKVHEGLRVISLQTNFANNLNFWLLMNNTDPGGQLAWLIQQLLQAERAGDKVHIIGHIPPSGFTHSFGWSYHSIVNRFESTITGQFFGHTHKDEFEIFFDDTNTTRATSVALIGPSITPDHLNSGFRIYTVDGDYTGSSNAVLDFTSYYMNLTDANLKNKPTWQQEYVTKEAFSMKSLHPADWADLVERFQQDDALFQRYYRYKYKLHPPTPTCENNCKASTLCDLVTSRTGDTSACTKFLVGGVNMADVERHRNTHRGNC